MVSLPENTFPIRRPAEKVTPVSEDSGLFRTALCDLMLELIPQVRRNERDDLIVRGFVDRKIEIDIWFAGRRAKHTGPLERQLKTLMQSARQKAAAGAEPEVTKIRLPVRVLGCWRRSRFRDASGWETGSYHFVAACWSMLDPEGKTVYFGERPLVYTPAPPTSENVKEAR